MKVKRIKKKKFNPIVIKIKIETQEELDGLHKMLGDSGSRNDYPVYDLLDNIKQERNI